MQKVAGAIAIWVGLTAVLASASAAEQRGGSEADYAEIRHFHERSIAKYNAGDIAGAIDDYLPQLRALQLKSVRIKSRDDLAADMQKSFARNAPKIVADIEEMEVNGRGVGAWAYIICRYAFVAMPKDKSKPASEIADGRYTALLKKTATGWKVLLDIDNGAPGAAPDLIARIRAESAP